MQRNSYHRRHAPAPKVEYKRSFKSSAYSPVDTLADPDGVSVRITKRRNKNGMENYSFQFFRAYEHSGQKKETSWFDGRHIPAFVRLMQRIDMRLKVERDRADFAL
ncbi:MAG: hypothetical protein R3322_00040 [Kiloniellales bacterium]|nr:hypothetical protein [Kiloniellales bacterium]